MSQLARNTDPQTSHDAAARVGEFSDSQQQLILACLIEHGPLGAEGISAMIKQDHDINIQPYAIRKRLPELEKVITAHAGDFYTVDPTGNVLRTSSGRQEREWAAS